MPIYEYKCTRCNFRFERKQSFDDQPVTSCPQCQGNASRLFQSVAIIYKGSGFYTTDYGSGRSSSSAAPENKEPENKEKEKEKATEKGAKAEENKKG